MIDPPTETYQLTNRPTNQLTSQPTNQQTDMRVQGEVTLPMKRERIFLSDAGFQKPSTAAPTTPATLDTTTSKYKPTFQPAIMATFKPTTTPQVKLTHFDGLVGAN